MKHTYQTCPACGKRGVTLRQRPRGEDHYGCRYCGWHAYTEASEDQQERERLEKAQSA